MIGPLMWSLAQLASPSVTMQQDPYFPPGFAQPSIACDGGSGARPMAIVSDFENGWYSQHLHAAGEPSLYIAAKTPPAGDNFILRFTWLRSFHPPLFIRVVPSPGGGLHLIAKQLSGAGGYDPGKIAKTVNRPMSAAETEALRAAVAKTAIFDQPPADCALGLDGAQWIIEGVDRAGYHFVKRWTPEDGAVRAIGLHLIGLSGWNVGDIY